MVQIELALQVESLLKNKNFSCFVAYCKGLNKPGLEIIFLFLFIGLIILFAFVGGGGRNYRSLKEFRSLKRNTSHPQISDSILNNEVEFYKKLGEEEKIRFRNEIQWFLENIRITPIGFELTELDRLLVAASGIIPIFNFPEWHFYDLDEVMLFKDSINLDFETNAHDSNILGMVGTGKMERKMALSRKALYDGFNNKTDKFNTAIHEFIHMVDIADGTIDGLPKVLMDKQYALPWLKLIREKTSRIKTGNSDIDSYGATNLSEFFAVAGEYFFERPDLLKKNHPELFEQMNNFFHGKNTS